MKAVSDKDEIMACKKRGKGAPFRIFYREEYNGGLRHRLRRIFTNEEKKALAGG